MKGTKGSACVGRDTRGNGWNVRDKVSFKPFLDLKGNVRGRGTGRNLGTAVKLFVSGWRA